MKIEDAIKQKKFAAPQVKAWVNLIYTFNSLMDQINQVLKPIGVTQQQYNVLRILRGRDGQPATCGEVKNVMMDKNPDLTRLSDRLVAKGLIKRTINEKNRREIDLVITEEGLRLLDKIDPALKASSQFLHNLTDEEAEKLSDLLDKFRG
ncbi:MarR family winged helix-turn-helix transcriptional regulator [Negadavirga shengliensis]|uniref:MarR family winged helix-turn-helix transcriptional regulator n=1 Tax=Negadavirga shengliensis TaxID=1389218 RepID=A0ABV9T601_9BACT